MVLIQSQLRYAQAQAEARDLENQLVRADRLITVGVMATEIAHEVGTPLAVVRGRAEQVIREIGTGRGAEDLRVIIKQVDQISSTIPFEKRSVALALVVERTRELLTLKLEARQLQLQIQVLDHGCGISPEHLKSVFDPFFTTKPRGEGTGLGLSITAGIVRNHAGHIDLRSSPGEGTTVALLWPASSQDGSPHV
jgi:two-component system sensor histidine kinase HydH